MPPRGFVSLRFDTGEASSDNGGRAGSVSASWTGDSVPEVAKGVGFLSDSLLSSINLPQGIQNV